MGYGAHIFHGRKRYGNRRYTLGRKWFLRSFGPYHHCVYGHWKNRCRSCFPLCFGCLCPCFDPARIPLRILWKVLSYPHDLLVNLQNGVPFLLLFGHRPHIPLLSLPPYAAPFPLHHPRSVGSVPPPTVGSALLRPQPAG